MLTHVVDFDLDPELCEVSAVASVVGVGPAAEPAAEGDSPKRGDTTHTISTAAPPSEPSQKRLPDSGACEDDEADGTLWAAWVNLFACCVGSSIVLLPSMVEHLGLAGASLVILAPALLSAITMRMLIQLADAASVAKDYTGVISEFLGRCGERIAFACSLVYLFLITASCIAFAVEVLPDVFAFVSPSVAGLLALAVAAPFACMTSLERLSKTSSLGMVAVLYTLVVIMVQGFLQGHESPQAFAMTRTNLYFLIVAEGLVAFGGEIAVIELYLGVSKEKRKHFVRWAVDTSLAAILVTYLSVAAMAYVLFGHGVHTNVLLDLNSNVWGSVAQFAVTASNALRAPLFCVLFYVAIASKFPDTFKRVERFRAARPAIQLACLLLSGAFALGLHSVGLVIAIAGGTAGMAITELLPSLAWLQARRARKVQKSFVLDAAACFMVAAFPFFSSSLVVAWVMELGEAS